MTRKIVLERVKANENVGSSLAHPRDKASSKAPSHEGIRFRVLTHNIRYATSAPFKGEERWPIRRPLLCSELAFHSNDPATFICLQEVLHSQLADIMQTLNETANSGKWAYIGVGRDDGMTAGEYSPILYRPDVWKLTKWDTCWLSPTPRVPSKGWDAASTRIATIGHFIHSQTGHKVIITTTHFDDQGVVSRKHSAELILEVLDFEAGFAGASATILTGDFNSPPDDQAYKIMTAPGSIMADVADIVPKELHYGNEMTFSGFSADSAPSRIDFIFTKKQDMVEFGSYGVLANRFDDGVYISDHRACVTDVNVLPN